MEQCPPLHLSEVAIEKGAFGSPWTKVANFTLTYTYLPPILVSLTINVLCHLLPYILH